MNYIGVFLLAFVCETVDSSLGMGYGTILTPVLFLLGYSPLEIVPLVLFSEFLSGITASFMHHKVGNVNLKPGTRHFKTALILGFCSIIGSIIAVFFAISVSATLIQGYIAFLLIILGLTNYITINKKISFSWKKIILLGGLASFNKGLSGGGYGPLVTGGQLLSGLNSKNAVSITSLAEGLTCLIGVLTYLTLNNININYHLGIALLAGALLSTPVSVHVVKKIKENMFKNIISISILTLGLLTFIKTFSETLIIKNIPLIILTMLLTFPLAYYIMKNNLYDKKYQ